MPATNDRANMGLAIRFLNDLACLGGLRSCGSPRNLGYLICLIMPEPTLAPIVCNFMGGSIIFIISIIIIGAAVGQRGNAAVGKRGNALLTTDGLGSATVVRRQTSLLIADLGARKNGVIGATVGQRGNAWAGSDI